MKAKELNNKLLKCFPEIGEQFKECVLGQDGEDTGSHIVFSCVFVPYVINCLNTNDLNGIRKCSDFMEEVISLNDLYAEEVIAFSVLEDLMFAEDLNVGAYEFLGKKAKRLYNEVRDWWKNKN